MHKYQKQINACNSALLMVRELIPQELFADVDDYINKYDEWGLGIEVLIDQIHEYDIKVTHEQFVFIYQAMQSMQLDESERIKLLRDQCTSS